MQTIKVKILEGGKTAKEVNKKKFPERARMGGLKWLRELDKYNKQEGKIMFFDIINPNNTIYLEGSTYIAEIINDKQIRIL